jgi:hypothetical protein
MQGMLFLIVGEKGPINHGIIAQQITPEKYLCQFARQPTSSRVVSLEEIQKWNLFPNEDQMNAFLLTVQAETGVPTKPVTELPPPDNSGKKPPAIKQVAKKKTGTNRRAKKKVAKKKKSSVKK